MAVLGYCTKKEDILSSSTNEMYLYIKEIKRSKYPIIFFSRDIFTSKLLKLNRILNEITV